MKRQLGHSMGFGSYGLHLAGDAKGPRWKERLEESGRVWAGSNGVILRKESDSCGWDGFWAKSLFKKQIASEGRWTRSWLVKANIWQDQSLRSCSVGSDHLPPQLRCFISTPLVSFTSLKCHVGLQPRLPGWWMEPWAVSTGREESCKEEQIDELAGEHLYLPREKRMEGAVGPGVNNTCASGLWPEPSRYWNGPTRASFFDFYGSSGPLGCDASTFLVDKAVSHPLPP